MIPGFARIDETGVRLHVLRRTWAGAAEISNEECVILPGAPLMPGGVKKANLPTKICPACDRPFAWRKKWARDWDSVIYCSDTCRKKR